MNVKSKTSEFFPYLEVQGYRYNNNMIEEEEGEILAYDFNLWDKDNYVMNFIHYFTAEEKKKYDGLKI